jgi:hypothetical protein
VVDTAFANYEEYRVLITRERDGSGALVVEREGLHSANNAVGIALPGRLLIPGEYTIELSGIVENADGVQFEPVVSASLSVVTAPE